MGLMFTGPRVTPITASSSSESFLGFFTMTNASTASKTAEPFQFCWPVNSLSGSIRVYTSDTAGNSASALSTFQVDNTASDLVGAARNRVLYGNTNISGSQTLKFWVYDSPTAPPTGSAITSASLLSTSWRISASFNIAGTTSTVDTNVFGAATTSFSASQVVYHGAWMNGPFRSCHVWSAPVQSGGAGMRLWFHAYASKSASSAVSTTNAITVVETDVVLRNMDMTRATPSNYYYGMSISRATSLTDGTLITTDQTDFDGNVTRMVYARSSPSATMTLSSAAVGFVNISRSSGSWDTDVLGAHFRPVTSSSTAAAYVVARTSNTTVSAYVYSAFATTSFASGAWVQEGVGHWYGGTWTFPVVVGTAPTSVALWGDNTSAVTPTTLAALDYLKSTAIVENYGFALSDISASGLLSTTKLDAMRADNAIRPFTVLGPTTYDMGDLITDVGRGGGRPDLGIITGYALAGLANYTAVGRRKIFENAKYWYTANYNGDRRYSGSPAAGSLGVVPRPDNGTDYKDNPAFGGTLFSYPSSGWCPWQNDTAHPPDQGHAAYLASGRLVWLDHLQETSFWVSNVGLDSAYAGTGANKTPWGDASNTTAGATSDVPFTVTQQRSSFWGFRGLLMASIHTPDDSRPLLFNGKDSYTASVTNTWKRGQFANTGYTDNADPAKNFFAASGPRYAGVWFATNNSQWAMYQAHYGGWVMAFAYDAGWKNATADLFIPWFAQTQIEAYTSPDVAPDYVTTGYWIPRMTIPGGTASTYCQTWAEVYQAQALYPPGYEVSQTNTNARRTASSVSLSATAGGSIVATFTGGPFGQGAWYAGSGVQPGGWLVFGSDGASGKAQIQSVSTSNIVVASTLVSGGSSFTTTSPTASAFFIPLPHPLDAAADGTLGVPPTDLNYMQLYRRACVGWQDRGLASASNCIAYIEARSGWSATMDVQLWVNPR